MNRKVELCRKSDFQLNQVLNNIDVLFVWFSFFSCFFSRISGDVSSFLLSSSTRIWSAFFMFSLWLSVFIHQFSFSLSFKLSFPIFPIELVKFDSRLQVFFFSQCDSFESSFCLIFFLSMKFPSSILWIAFENERVQKPYTSILIQLTIPFPFAYAKCIKRLFLTHSLSLSHSVNICVYTHSANVRPILNDIFHSCNIDKMKTGQITAMWPK